MIACVQMKLEMENYRTEAAFSAKIMEIMGRVRAEAGDGPLLVVFPEHVGTFCLLCDAPERVWSQPTFASAAKALLRGSIPSVLYHLLNYRVSPTRALVLAKAAAAERVYLSAFKQAALEYGAWIVAGSAVLRWGETRRVFNTAPVFTPTGQLIHRQHKVNLVEMEGSKGLDVDGAPLNYISVVQSPFGNLGVAVCLDAFSADVRERLKSLGAEILIQPSANNHPWNEWQQEDWLRSSYQAVVERGEFALAVNPMLVGDLWDLSFAGQSSIITPEGYAARAETADQEEILLYKRPQA
ncbi:MAG: carbon-nitrogen hydrolase family protein [Bacillota bacterium]|nr:carbon-nitrogen hydrolase family protein [Bacillota bacterium]